MRRGKSILKNFTGTRAENLPAKIQQANADLESQLNRGTVVQGIKGNTIPRGKEADATVRLGPQYFLELAMSDAQGNRRAVTIPMHMADSVVTIADVPTGGAATAASCAAAINSMLALFRNIHLVQS